MISILLPARVVRGHPGIRRGVAIVCLMLVQPILFIEILTRSLLYSLQNRISRSSDFLNYSLGFFCWVKCESILNVNLTEAFTVMPD